MGNWKRLTHSDKWVNECVVTAGVAYRVSARTRASDSLLSFLPQRIYGQNSPLSSSGLHPLSLIPRLSVRLEWKKEGKRRDRHIHPTPHTQTHLATYTRARTHNRVNLSLFSLSFSAKEGWRVWQATFPGSIGLSGTLDTPSLFFHWDLPPHFTLHTIQPSHIHNNAFLPALFSLLIYTIPSFSLSSSLFSPHCHTLCISLYNICTSIHPSCSVSCVISKPFTSYPYVSCHFFFRNTYKLKSHILSNSYMRSYTHLSAAHFMGKNMLLLDTFALVCMRS